MKNVVANLFEIQKKCVFLDTETTGIEEKDRLIEVAYAVIAPDANKNKIQIEYKENLYNTEVPINPAASAVHGYAKWHIQDKDSFKNSEEYKDLVKLNEEGSVFIAHNSPFDLNMLEKEGISWNMENVVDTLRVAKHLIKNEEIESHSLQYLRYFFELDLMDEYQKLKNIMNLSEIRPHTALSDIFILMLFVEFLMQKYGVSIKDMLKLSKTPVLHEKINFGNVFEKGTPYEYIINNTYEQYGRVKTGTSYLTWAVENMENLDFDVKHSIKHWLGVAYFNNPIPELKKYFDYAMFLTFNKEQFNQGLMFSKKPKEYYLLALASKIAAYKKKAKKDKLTNEEKLLYSYIKDVRIFEIDDF